MYKLNVKQLHIFNECLRVSKLLPTIFKVFSQNEALSNNLWCNLNKMENSI